MRTDQRNWRVTIRTGPERWRRQRVFGHQLSAFGAAFGIARRLKCEVEVCMLRPSFMAWTVKPDDTITGTRGGQPYPEDRERWKTIKAEAIKTFKGRG
jgi:hypothetical protein